MTRAECLHTAEEIVTKDRNSQYGEPEDCFALIARLWTDYTAVNLSSADVAAMMILLKVARVRNGKAKDDSWVDMAGYAACGAECALLGTQARRVRMDSRIIISTTDEDKQESLTDDGRVLFALISRIAKAKEKHPVFADGMYQGVGVLGEEYGELCQALNKGEGEERVMDEAFDLLCVAWRFCRGDWRTGNE